MKTKKEDIVSQKSNSNTVGPELKAQRREIGWGRKLGVSGPNQEERSVVGHGPQHLLDRALTGDLEEYPGSMTNYNNY